MMIMGIGDVVELELPLGFFVKFDRQVRYNDLWQNLYSAIGLNYS